MVTEIKRLKKRKASEEDGIQNVAWIYATKNLQ